MALWRAAGIVTLAAVISSCGAARHHDTWPANEKGPSTVTLTADQRRIADQLVNVFEYGSTAARYDAVTALPDGRGYTCGRIGFTTSSTEVRDVVQAYLVQRPHDPLGRYLPRLRDLAANERGDTTGLAGFPADWARAADDPAFRAIQDRIADRLTYEPAIVTARRLGIRTPLGVAILYDTAVQHGTGSDPDGLDALIVRTGRAARGDPAAGIAERDWLLKFLDVRADDLRHPSAGDSQQVWAESVDRAEALRRLVSDDQYRLAAPVKLTVFGDAYVLR
jgi:chitosanase